MPTITLPDGSSRQSSITLYSVADCGPGLYWPLAGQKRRWQARSDGRAGSTACGT